MSFRRGTLVKLLHNGQKVYAAVDSETAEGITVKYLFPSPEGLLTVVTVTVTPDKLRATSWEQRGETASFIRQLVGVPLEEPKPVRVAQAAGPLKAITPEMIGNFIVQGQPIKDMPEGDMKEMAKATAKTMLSLGSNSIEWK